MSHINHGFLGAVPAGIYNTEILFTAMESPGAAKAAVLALVLAAVLLCIPSSDGAGTAVAEIEGGSQYSSLSAAVADASDGDTILLLADDASTAAVQVAVSLTIDGQGHSFRGRLVLQHSSEGASLEVRDLVMNGGSGPLVGGTPSSPVALTLSGCTFASSASVLVSAECCSSLTVSDCSFAASGQTALAVAVAGGECSSVSVTGCTFTGACSGPVMSFSQESATSTVAEGTIGSLTVSGCDLSGIEADEDVRIGSGSERSSAFAASVSAQSATDVVLETGSGTIGAALSAGARLSSSAEYSESWSWDVSVTGTVSLTGTPGSAADVCAVGRITISDYTGAVWFDSSRTYGISSEASTQSWTVTVETVGMILGGTTCSAGTTVSGSFVVSDGLEVGGTLTVAEGSVLTINSAATLTGGDMVNLGTIEVYGIMTNDVDNNDGTINAHSGCTISGEITGNAVVNPVPATVTTVLTAVAGQEFSFTISPEEGTSVTGYEGPSWLTMSGGVLSGTPTSVGTYDVTVTAASAEYSLTLQYRIVVSEAPGESGWSASTILCVIVAVIAVIAVAAIVLRWFGRI